MINLWVGYILFIVGLVALHYIIDERKKGWKILILIFLFAGMIFSNIGTFAQHYHNLTKEVNLWQVSAKGQTNFHAEIEIPFKDGKPQQIILIPNTTVLVQK
jgi:hypothetical protein